MATSAGSAIIQKVRALSGSPMLPHSRNMEHHQMSSSQIVTGNQSITITAFYSYKLKVGILIEEHFGKELQNHIGIDYRVFLSVYYIPIISRKITF